MAMTTRAARILTKTAHPPGVEGRHKERFASSGECAHRFAAFVQTHGRSANTFFNHGVFYSYGDHFPVARFVMRPKGAGRFVLMSSRSYSNTTSGHQCDVRTALRGQTVYTVDDVLANTRGEHLTNFRKLEAEANTLASKATRARTHGEYLIADSLDTMRQANAYAEAVGLSERLALPDASDTAKFAAECRARADAISEKAKAKADRENRARSAKLAGAVAEWEQKLNAWREGGEFPGYCPDRGHPLASVVFLRVRGSRLETSLHAIVPLSAAVPVLEIMRSGITHINAPDWLNIDGFKLREVNQETRRVVIGCHTVTFDEIERVAKSAGL